MESRGSNMRITEKIMWLSIGALLGAGVALLYAPRTGKDTRKIIRRKAEDAKDAIIQTGEHIKETIAETGETIIDAGRDAYRKSVSAAAGAAEGAAELFGRSRG